ncbi:hypothetical protein PPERSA_09270 [Pseudocohnilembus persalinus]|uniref:Elongator complex protein 6 n=1 Tax=Pseudocohnilembus persalinus TaxID=266149 RepID=A0A0V0QM60_PSEPJ|nr:hypothetical protein PPERSA_09270 [Pseudocohnilembus persalinus]|eukprot:KRX03258.1 hypothetical protein PPERSA_09270 [Pseudocohnilembus persalinus]
MKKQMFHQISELIPEFPLQEEKTPKNQFFLIKDTIQNEANFIISSLLNFFIKKINLQQLESDTNKENQILFIGAHQNYAHYLATSKKMGCSLEGYITKKQLQYIDLMSEANDWIPQDLPYTEKTSVNFVQPPQMVKKLTFSEQNQEKTMQSLLNIVKDAIKDGKKQIIIDNLTSIYNCLDNKEIVFQFYSELHQIIKQQPDVNLYMLTTCLPDLKQLKIISLIERYADIIMEFQQNPSGYQQDVAGQLIIKFSNEKFFKFIVQLTENSVTISRSYQA